MHDFMLVNEAVLPASSKTMAPGQVGAVNGWGVFSTLRVKDGVLFEWQRHYNRMAKDAALLKVPFPDSSDWFEAQLHKLIEANHAHNSTLRVIVLRNKGGMWEGPSIDRPFDLYAFTTNLKNWGQSVKLGLVPQARHAANQFAGTKMLSWSFNLCMYDQAHENGFDEVVLLNERDEVSELTSANLFAVYGNLVLTPPISSGCLPGITRALLLENINVPGIEIKEQTLTLADLEKADGLFITSSTRDLLPVASVQSIRINQNDEIRQRLSRAFEQHLENYTNTHQRPSTRP